MHPTTFFRSEAESIQTTIASRDILVFETYIESFTVFNDNQSDDTSHYRNGTAESLSRLVNHMPRLDRSLPRTYASYLSIQMSCFIPFDFSHYPIPFELFPLCCVLVLEAHSPFVQSVFQA